MVSKITIGIGQSLAYTASLYEADIDQLLWWSDDEDDLSIDQTLSEFANSRLAQIWANYAKAMARRRPESILWLSGFAHMASHNDTVIYSSRHGHVLGKWSHGVFKPSHFAPRSIRSGAELIAELKEFGNVVFFVTEDLAPMLRKLGYFGHGSAIIPMLFRGELVMKTIMASSEELLAVILGVIAKLNNGEIELDDIESSFKFKAPLTEDNLEDRYYIKRFMV